MTATLTTPAGALARIAWQLTRLGDPFDAAAVAEQAAAAYRAGLTPAQQARLDAEYAREGIAGHTDPHRHFDKSWRR